jgi:hypothetical protein
MLRMMIRQFRVRTLIVFTAVLAVAFFLAAKCPVAERDSIGGLRMRLPTLGEFSIRGSVSVITAAVMFAVIGIERKHWRDVP